MEWVETIGRTVEDAKEQALDQLGVDESEAEFEVLEEPKAGLFGRVRREARVRARVAPTQPRPKTERRERRRKGGSTGRNGDARQGGKPAGKPSGGAKNGTRAAEGSGSKNSNRSSKAAKAPAASKTSASSPQGGPEMSASDVTLAEQGKMVEEFLDGLLGAFELEGQVASEEIDEEMVEVRIEGSDLGLLIGPKGQTLSSVQELARTVVQRQAGGSPQGRFRLDIGGYRQRRREALERFTRDVAAQVLESGVQRALEPMGSADRKVVHDTANDIDGVSTVSEGEDPRRRVVIVPE